VIARRPGCLLAGALLGQALLGVSAAQAAPSGPVAVMPFKNLNQETELRWLAVGIAETMISDLRRAKAVKVVERDQLDRAMAELALQGGQGTDLSTAVRAGKMVGARTMVLGSYQRAGKQLRIAARFVSVETGLVQETAKVTGAMTRVFHLQDQIVDRLLGRKKSARKQTPRRRKASQNTLKAYELYAMSLTAGTKVERVRFLKASLEVEPDFSYALEDLEALEKRMKRYEREADKQRRRQADEARRLFAEEGLSPQERSQRAFTLLTNHMTSFRYQALLADARRLRELDLPPYGTVSVREFASFSEFQSHMMLKQHDLALQVGERHLAEFPGGMYYTAVEMSMRSEMRHIRKREAGKAKAQAELEEIESERAEALAKATEKRPVHPARIRGYDFKRCSVVQQHAQHQLALKECQVFVDRYRTDPDETTRELVLMARWQRIQAMVELGRFDRAREHSQRLADESPEFAEKMAMRTVMGTWPRD